MKVIIKTRVIKIKYLLESFIKKKVKHSVSFVKRKINNCSILLRAYQLFYFLMLERLVFRMLNRKAWQILKFKLLLGKKFLYLQDPTNLFKYTRYHNKKSSCCIDNF